jgi:hypothetical protein
MPNTRHVRLNPPTSTGFYRGKPVTHRRKYALAMRHKTPILPSNQQKQKKLKHTAKNKRNPARCVNTSPCGQAPAWWDRGPVPAPHSAAAGRFDRLLRAILHMLRPSFFRERKLKPLIRRCIPFTMK